MDGMVEAVLEDVAVAGSGEFFILLLKTQAGEFVPITIGHLEAMSILAGRAQEKLARPLAHDLMLSGLELLGASLNRVEVTELLTTAEGGTFYAKVVLDNRGIELELDARPSDALALAVRVGAPIWVAEAVVEQIGMTDFGGGAEA
ncbi:MAG: hypothetical protein AVDCRST_MAG86-3002 [uncultured Truepera sp.]|uniref:BFN domain-containing protein n=1 Tax=uncultured Truepera sp. TaxID=543023 RepID=A0A6J4VMC6_9DEIN|nr:MAG: hypothetical protein AVDCRST_MAG86-3002 [uncultured Truepera sp.]